MYLYCVCVQGHKPQVWRSEDNLGVLGLELKAIFPMSHP